MKKINKDTLIQKSINNTGMLNNANNIINEERFYNDKIINANINSYFDKSNSRNLHKEIQNFFPLFPSNQNQHSSFQLLSTNNSVNMNKSCDFNHLNKKIIEKNQFLNAIDEKNNIKKLRNEVMKNKIYDKNINKNINCVSSVFSSIKPNMNINKEDNKLSNEKNKRSIIIKQQMNSLFKSEEKEKIDHCLTSVSKQNKLNSINNIKSIDEIKKTDINSNFSKMTLKSKYCKPQNESIYDKIKKKHLKQVSTNYNGIRNIFINIKDKSLIVTNPEENKAKDNLSKSISNNRYDQVNLNKVKTDSSNENGSIKQNINSNNQEQENYDKSKNSGVSTLNYHKKEKKLKKTKTYKLSKSIDRKDSNKKSISSIDKNDKASYSRIESREMNIKLEEIEKNNESIKNSDDKSSEIDLQGKIY